MFPFDRLLPIDKNAAKPLYLQIAQMLSEAIRNGVLQPGTALPSSRNMAALLQVHRKTIIAAYDELSTQDWIETQPRKKTVVAAHIPLLQPQEWSQPRALLPYENAMPTVFKSFTPTPSAALPGLPELIVDDGRPDIRISPIDLLLKTYRSSIQRRYASRNAEQNMSQGSDALRSVLEGYLAESRGINISKDHLLVTHGAQMSIYIASALLIRPGTAIIVGTPNYPMANAVFQQQGAELVEVGVDQFGIDTDQIEKICRLRTIAAVYVIPHHHYPTTVTLSVERRMKLLRLSLQYAFLIIEDDYDYDYHYTSSPYLPLASAQHCGNVIYIGSFSKILDPQLRIGFMVAPKNFIEQAVAFRKTIDIGGDGYMQDALAALIRDGELKRHIKKAKKTYQLRKDFLEQLLDEHLSSYLTYQSPSGGMAIWLCFKSEISVVELGRWTAKHRLQINDINQSLNAFRFGFASLNEREIAAAIALVTKGVLALAKKSPQADC